MIDTSKMTAAAFIRALRMRYRSMEQPEITADEVRRLLRIASGLRTFRDIDKAPGSPIALATADGDLKAMTRGA